MSIRVGFAGMTHLGINSAVATAERGFDVLGYDADQRVITGLQNGKLPVVEPELDDLAKKNVSRMAFTSNLADLKSCDVVYISADVPTNDQAQSDLIPIRKLVDDVGANLRRDAILVVLCQVPPGFTRGIPSVPPERLAYQVETLVFGRAVERAMYPERFIIGCADPAKPLPAAFATVLGAFGCPILPMRYESAELAKISINFCLVASVTVANTLAEVSEAVGADWSEIVPALKLDRRIGAFSYLAPGLGISGGNLERDLRTVLDIAEIKNTDVGVVQAWIENSQYRKDWPWRVLEREVLSGNPGAQIAILGLAYKENTHSTKNSPSLLLLSHLTKANVRVHDPVVPASIVPFAQAADSVLDCLQDADVVVVATPWPQYRDLKVEDLARSLRGRVVIDPYRMLDGAKLAAGGFAYHTLGMPALKGARPC
jgi:UDPglucose 6-dehydrogenase